MTVQPQDDQSVDVQSEDDQTGERHYLRYEFTVMTKTESFPVFSAVCESDDKQIAHYSNEERVFWIRENLTDWTEAPGEPPESRDWYLDQLSKLSNCPLLAECPELHVLQRIVGGELEKLPDGTRKSLKSFNNYGYDGNYLKKPKDKWVRHTGHNQFLKHFLKTCSDWISKFNNTINTSPDVHVFATKVPGDRSKLNLVCLATGFYPRDVQMNIRLNRINLENQTSSGIRPNGDETFQMRISVKIDRNHEGSYDCLVTHSSLTEPASKKWDGTSVDGETGPEWRFIAGVAGTVVAGLGLLCWLCLKMQKVHSQNAVESLTSSVPNPDTEQAANSLVNYETGVALLTGI
ncbi:class I histocompatibility antigen, Non-RT1.A alpha-1 chain-like [Siphateles boraxobius]|uniref:class I histocompatibility antigen, Non-RT1.A alpha-1 chain-like n=1 Tax=Siphateles boraxobius TaxID=180520 RepID=UPI004064A328